MILDFRQYVRPHLTDHRFTKARTHLASELVDAYRLSPIANPRGSGEQAGA